MKGVTLLSALGQAFICTAPHSQSYRGYRRWASRGTQACWWSAAPGFSFIMVQEMLFPLSMVINSKCYAGRSAQHCQICLMMQKKLEIQIFWDYISKFRQSILCWSTLFQSHKAHFQAEGCLNQRSWYKDVSEADPNEIIEAETSTLKPLLIKGVFPWRNIIRDRVSLENTLPVIPRMLTSTRTSWKPSLFTPNTEYLVCAW